MDQTKKELSHGEVMQIDKCKILENLCYTELVYGRINKKLNSQLSKDQIENIIYQSILDAPVEDFQRKGKNYYIMSQNIKITINSNTFRVITVDPIQG